MHARSSLSESQREAAVAWFEKGIADKATASLLGVSRGPVNRLYRRWRIHGRGALVAKPTKRMYSFEFKIALVEPGAIPCSGPRGLGSYLASPTFGDQFTNGAAPFSRMTSNCHDGQTFKASECDGRVVFRITIALRVQRRGKATHWPPIGV
jgi:hypothetical protein